MARGMGFGALDERLPGRVLLARGLALAADILQIVALPLFLPGAASPWDDVLDVVVGVLLVRLLGWHAAFLPAFLSELVPALDLFPTWTAAVLVVTRRGGLARTRGR